MLGRSQPNRYATTLVENALFYSSSSPSNESLMTFFDFFFLGFLALELLLLDSLVVSSFSSSLEEAALRFFARNNILPFSSTAGLSSRSLSLVLVSLLSSSSSLDSFSCTSVTCIHGNHISTSPYLSLVSPPASHLPLPCLSKVTICAPSSSS